MSLSRLISVKGSEGAGARGVSRISWKTVALIGLPLGLTGLALFVYYLRKQQESKSDPDPIPETPLEATLASKLRGNKFFKGGQYQQAINLYEQGLEQCPPEAVQERAALYQNLAAAKENLRQYESAVADCTSALQLSPKYLKALNRRAHLYEKLEKWDECLFDVTACCIFEKFKNPDNIVCLDQVLKKIGQLKAVEERSKMSCELPSAAFIRNYLSAFAWDPFTNQPDLKSKPVHPESTNGGSADDLSKTNGGSMHKPNQHADDHQSSVDVNRMKEPAKSAQLEWNQALDYLIKGDYEHSMVAVTKAISLFEAAMKDPSCFDLIEAEGIHKTAGAGEEIQTDHLSPVNGTNDHSQVPPGSSDQPTETQEPSTAHGESKPKHLSSDAVKAFIKSSYDKAALLYATYLALAGRSDEAKQRFQTIGAEDWGASPMIRVNALIKAACLSMSVDQDVAACLYDFQRAQGACPECPDVYLHRGQINLLADQLDEALHDLNTAVKLKPEFSVAQAQRLYTLYRVALTSSSDMSRVDARVEEFRRLVKKYPNCLETHSLFAQILTERGEFEEGDKEFAEVLALAPDSGLAYAHRGLLQLRWKQDREAAFRWFTQGAKADPKCELIHELLGQLAVESGQFTKALEHFDLAIRQAKTQNDLAHFISLREGVNAQLSVCQQYDISIPEVLSNLQREQQNFFMAMQQ